MLWSGISVTCCNLGQSSLITHKKWRAGSVLKPFQVPSSKRPWSQCSTIIKQLSLQSNLLKSDGTLSLPDVYVQTTWVISRDTNTDCHSTAGWGMTTTQKLSAFSPIRIVWYPRHFRSPVTINFTKINFLSAEAQLRQTCLSLSLSIYILLSHWLTAHTACLG